MGRSRPPRNDDWDDTPVISPPNDRTVDLTEKRVILYLADGTPLGNKKIGFTK
jgi:hypothetical protein